MTRTFLKSELGRLINIGLSALEQNAIDRQPRNPMDIAAYIALWLLATWGVCRILGIQMPWD
jgi:hypothetical protein